MKATPYIGVTGPVSVGEVRGIGQAFANAGYSIKTHHVPMIGILVSQKTLQGQPTTNLRYPSIKQVPALIKEAAEYGIPMIHYNTREMESLADQVTAILTENLECQGVQLNIPWPDRREVIKIKERFPIVDLVLQLSERAMQGLSPETVALRVTEYSNVPTYVLIDPSGGKGREFNVEDSLKIYQELLGEGIMIGFAGGFTGENVGQRSQNLIQRLGTNKFSIDAEGGLRDKITDAYGDDLLNLQKVRSYLQESSKVFLS